MSIEEGFRDLKSHRYGLGLSYHRTHSAGRLQILLLVGHLAMTVIWLLGLVALAKGIHYRFQANTVLYKRVLSVIFMGLAMVREQCIKLVEQDIEQAWITLRKSLQESLWQS